MPIAYISFTLSSNLSGQPASLVYYYIVHLTTVSSAVARSQFKVMPLTISLNGADDVGKTTQTDLIPHHHSISLVGSLHDCAQKIGQTGKARSLDE